MYDIAVVIPSHNRAKLLKRTLELFNEQSYPAERYEVIVVDDGSTDESQEALGAMQKKAGYNLKYASQEHKGPAAARNRGIKEAEAQFILFTGDDIFPSGDLIARHMSLLSEHPHCAILGYVDWCKDEKVTDFMRYLAPNGFQFRFNSIKDPGDCDFRHFYTSNISLAKSWFSEDGFDEDFPYGALEDTELSYRLKKKGLRIIFNPDALGYHCHQMTIDSFSQRMRLTGISCAIMLKKHPELKAELLPINAQFASPLFSILARITLLRRMNKRFYWLCRITYAYLEGVKEGKKSRI